MNILISNDDGYLAPGIQELARRIRRFGNVTVVAPEQNHSGASNSLTLNRPLSVRQVQENVFFVNGTPSDCVHIALTGLLPQKPDIVLSGINCGQNMGDDVLYSGTVAAAMEGFLFGCPSFAFSQVHSGWSCLDSAAEVAEYIVDNFIKNPLPAPFLLNVNIPNTTIDQLSGLVVTRLGRRHAAQSVIEQVNPRGETIYWLGAAGDTIIEVIVGFALGAAGDARDSTQGTDFWATSHNYVSMTPLQVDMTNYGMLDTVRAWCNSFQS